MEKHREEHKKKQEEKSPHEVESWEGESWEKALKKVDEIKGWELQKCKKVIPNLSRLTNLVELDLWDCFECRESSNPLHTCDLGWIGGLSKLKKLRLSLLNVVVPPTGLGPLSLLEDLDLRGLHPHPLEQPRPSLRPLGLDNFSSAGSPPSNSEILSILTLGFSRLQEIQFDGLSQLQRLRVGDCPLQSLSIPSSVTQLEVIRCPNLIEIRFPGMSASLEDLHIENCGSIERIVFCGEVGSLGVLDQSESSSSESTYFAPGVLLLPNALKKLERLNVQYCENLLEIRVIELSNWKNLHSLEISMCPKLRVVESLDELEFLTKLKVYECPSLEALLDITNSKIPDKCLIRVADDLHHQVKEEAKMEWDAEELDELELQSSSSASFSDHEISEEPTSDNVKEGTLPARPSSPKAPCKSSAPRSPPCPPPSPPPDDWFPMSSLSFSIEDNPADDEPLHAGAGATAPPSPPKESSSGGSKAEGRAAPIENPGGSTLTPRPPWI
ncbi:hypothetical protein NL676_034270 [Syzygium grande]|nr:hypothetical protein NL676_034270 [Syzygium grande]